MPSPRSGRSAVSLVLGIFLFIGLIAGIAALIHQRKGSDDQEFTSYLSTGRTHHQQGDASRAIASFQRALAMHPANPDVHLNLANAFLLGDQAIPAAKHALEAIHLEPGKPAGHYLLGCALLRQNQYSNAVQSLQQAKDMDRTVNAVSFQLGRAYMGLGNFEGAAEEFYEVTQFETEHPSAFYQLSQALLRLDRTDEAAAALETHQALAATQSLSSDAANVYEQCVHTEIIAPFNLEQPARNSIAIQFSDQTSRAFNQLNFTPTGPVGLIDINRRGHNDLLALDPHAGLRLLINSNGVFYPHQQPVPLPTNSTFHTLLVGDINNDRYEDALLLGSPSSVAIRFATNGYMTDASRLAQFTQLNSRAGALGDFDFTGKLSLFSATQQGQPHLLRGLGTFIFRNVTTNSSIPPNITDINNIVVDDWNNDDLMDVVLVRQQHPPFILSNLRGGGFSTTNQPAGWPVAKTLALADWNNDFRMDAALVTEKSIDVFFGGLRDARRLPAKGNGITGIRAFDYDNDGWLDILTWGSDGIRIWRNRGHRGFQETTRQLGLDGIGSVRHVVTADLDQDGDSDIIATLADGSLRYLQNDGAHVHGMVRVRLLGNRSNASGLGTKIELTAGNWRTLRSVQQLPVEIGTGNRRLLDSLTVRWFDTQMGSSDVEVQSKYPLNLIELTIPQGSCPYLYAWNGSEFHFITDLLGAAPLGLPVAPGHYIHGDPDEIVWIGNSQNVQPIDGQLQLRITEELCEILYLDHVALLTVDHPAESEVHSTSRLMPGPPFPQHEVWQLENRVTLRNATALDGTDVTESLQYVDGTKLSPSPSALRVPQLRGLAEPHGVILDFGPLQTHQPLVLALTGWLRFGGGMANIGAAHRDDLPFPFPTLEAELADGSWQPLPITVGSPAGKTKTILVPLEGHLPQGTKRLRLTQAFEIHWDRIALFTSHKPASIHQQAPDVADLHWHGYSEFADLPWHEPQTPVFDQRLPQPRWHRTPSGWATHYGDVRPLLDHSDDTLVIVAGGDGLDLRFNTHTLPPIPQGMQRNYFLKLTGWDKDADYHVVEGTTIDPLPWRSMDYQQYGSEPVPSSVSPQVHQRHQETRTRWVGPKTFSRKP